MSSLASTMAGHAPNWIRRMRRRVRPSVGLVIGTAGLAVICMLAILGPALWPADPLGLGPNIFAPPSIEHPMGTDDLGRDVLARVIQGARVSLLIGLLSALVAALVGVVVGSIAGYVGGVTDEILMRGTEIFQVIPRFLLAIVIVSLFGTSQTNIILVIGLLSWPAVARVVRAQFLVLRSEEFVLAAMMSGARPIRVIGRHILPNVVPYIVVSIFLQMGAAILVESFLSFVGLGNPSMPSWGMLLQHAQIYLQSAWWLTTFPGLALSLTIFSLNLVGDSLSGAGLQSSRRH